MKRILRPDSNCVDVGCHLGDVLDQMIHCAPHGKFFAFEPLPDFFQHLQARFAANSRVKLFDLALSDTAGTASFQRVVNSPAYSGFLRTDANRSKDTVQTIDVRKARLDDILGGIDVNFVKIDVEGAELQMLRGGLGTIRRCKPHIIFEHGESAAAYGTSHDDVFDFITGECGLQISLLDIFLRRGHALSRSQFSRIAQSEFYFIAHGVDPGRHR